MSNANEVCRERRSFQSHENSSHHKAKRNSVFMIHVTLHVWVGQERGRENTLKLYKMHFILNPEDQNCRHQGKHARLCSDLHKVQRNVLNSGPSRSIVAAIKCLVFWPFKMQWPLTDSWYIMASRLWSSYQGEINHKVWLTIQVTIHATLWMKNTMNKTDIQ